MLQTELQCCNKQLFSVCSDIQPATQLSVRSFHNPHKNKMSATHPATELYEAQWRAARLVFGLQVDCRDAATLQQLQPIPRGCWGGEIKVIVENQSQSKLLTSMSRNANKYSMFLAVTARPRNQLTSVQTSATSRQGPHPDQAVAGELDLTNWLGSQIENWSLFGQNAYSDRTFSPELHNHAQKLYAKLNQGTEKSRFLHS